MTATKPQKLQDCLDAKIQSFVNHSDLFFMLCRYLAIFDFVA
jgi:hypothetical protein